MKIIAMLDFAAGVGGGFHQAISAILQMQRLSGEIFDFEVFTTDQSSKNNLEKLGVRAEVIKISIMDKLHCRFAQNLLWQSIQCRLKIISPLERRLIQNKCDVVYFLAQSRLPSILQRLNYIGTLWDLCHRETPEFPEVRNFNEFFIREEIFKRGLPAALFTLTDSVRLAEMASEYYGVGRERFLPMPFSPSPYISGENVLKAEDVRKKYQLEGGYFYYPAQFWPHKNHIRILQAMLILRERNNKSPAIVFTGKDNGNLPHILDFIERNNLQNQVKILNYIPHEDLRGLYENAIAVVMPTYFGPTNLPPLEAWSIGVPVIYSEYFVEQVAEAALLVDPDSPAAVAEAMLKCFNPAVRKELISAGYLRLSKIEEQKVVAENKLCELISRYKKRRECWK